jgi:hypothetical protein
MEDMCAILVHIDTLCQFAVSITASMVPAVDHQALLSCLTSSPSESGAKESCTYNEIIVFRIHLF